MDKLLPRSAEELAAALASAAASNRRIRLGGGFSKDRMAGPIAAADVVLSTSAMTRILNYEPRDLTISVEAGMKWRDLTVTLAANRQMIPLDPPFFYTATVGGVVAANTSGPRRRGYGTARDVVIGMKFATLQGKIVSSGGMVVKNVAGLDMGKLMIGSFGTLAAIAVVNFKLAPAPPAARTHLLRYPSLDEAIAARDRLIRGVLQPVALDIVNPPAAARMGLQGFCVIAQASGNPAVLDRYSRELTGAHMFEGDVADLLWSKVREFTPEFLTEYPGGAVLRLSTTLEGVKTALQAIEGPALVRAGNGIIYRYITDSNTVWSNGTVTAVEFAPEEKKKVLDLWPSPGSDFAMMKKVKQLFDPEHLLNHGRLYGRI